MADSHCHYDDSAFDKDRDKLLDAMLLGENSAVGLLIHACTDEKSALYGIKMAETYENYYTSVGFHPECCDRLPEDYIGILEGLAGRSDKIVAVGEVGLDYHYDGYDRELQIRLLCDQIEFAQKHGLPLIFHCRDATADFLEIMRKYRPRGVVHCFSGSPEVARELVGLGLYVGFTGVLTFKNAKKVKKSFCAVPTDRILLETDCPYMAPEPYRGKRCTSDMIEYTAEAGAALIGVTPQELVDKARENTERLFNIHIT
ncbi:TatD family hydrolase [Ruminococcus sp. Marseille-P6503]|uniref:TatD family hydrolase n=1 Tax=Ruminococcus sp. Marseille-P6503 TaxID=2364796 RepID=UPI000F532A06